MSLSPEYQARLEEARASQMKGGDPASDELAALKRKLAAREGVGGYSANVAEIKARIAVLENGNG